MCAAQHYEEKLPKPPILSRGEVWSGLESLHEDRQVYVQFCGKDRQRIGLASAAELRLALTRLTKYPAQTTVYLLRELPKYSQIIWPMTWKGHSLNAWPIIWQGMVEKDYILLAYVDPERYGFCSQAHNFLTIGPPEPMCFKLRKNGLWSICDSCETSVRFEHVQKWKEHFDGLRERMTRLSDYWYGVPFNRSALEFRRNVYDFFVACHSLKDYLIHDDTFPANKKAAIDDYINQTPVLAICADFANLWKHSKLVSSKGGLRSGAEPSLLFRITLNVPGLEDPLTLGPDGGEVAICRWADEKKENWKSIGIDENDITINIYADIRHGDKILDFDDGIGMFAYEVIAAWDAFLPSRQ